MKPKREGEIFLICGTCNQWDGLDYSPEINLDTYKQELFIKCEYCDTEEEIGAVLILDGNLEGVIDEHNSDMMRCSNCPEKGRCTYCLKKPLQRG